MNRLTDSSIRPFFLLARRFAQDRALVVIYSVCHTEAHGCKSPLLPAVLA